MEEKDYKTIQDESLENQEGQYYDLNDLVSQIETVLPPIELNKEKLEKFEFDTYNFSKGLKNISYVCGEIVGLMNCGLSAKDAMDYILTITNIDHNQKLQDKINRNNIEVSKIQTVKVQTQEL